MKPAKSDPLGMRSSTESGESKKESGENGSGLGSQKNALMKVDSAVALSIKTRSRDRNKASTGSFCATR